VKVTILWARDKRKYVPSVVVTVVAAAVTLPIREVIYGRGFNT
jgi:hypothetical protein